jgi:hypothetical protein
MTSNSLRFERNNSSSAAGNLNNGFGGFGKGEGETPEMKGYPRGQSDYDREGRWIKDIREEGVCWRIEGERHPV